MTFRAVEGWTTRYGVVEGIHHTRGSGIVVLTLQDGTKLYAEAGPFYRAWSEAGEILGRTIVYAVDDAGALVGFDLTD